MADNFTFHMIVKGELDKVNELIDIMRNKRAYQKTITRILDTFIHDIVRIEASDNALTTATLSGVGKWSAQASLLEEHNNYFHHCIKQDINTLETNLVKESKRLGLDIEIYTEEPANGFDEYVLLLSGDIIKYETKNMTLHPTNDYINVDEFIKETGFNISQNEFDSNDFIKENGFNNDSEFTLTLND